MADRLAQLWVEDASPEIQEFVSGDLRELVKRIRASWSPRSIIISGSFGKGEGSVKRHNNRPYYLSDFEISLVRWRPISAHDLHVCASRWGAELGVDLGLYYNPPFKYTMRMMDRFFWKPGFLPVNFCDRCCSSRILDGYDYLSHLSKPPVTEIPVWEGIRLIFNRVGQALGHITSARAENCTVQQAFWLYRIVLACQDALLIAKKEYNVFYRARNDRLLEKYESLYPRLAGDLPTFPALAREATDFKLGSDIECTQQADVLLARTQRICRVVLDMLLDEDLGLRWQSFGTMYNSYPELSKVQRSYYRFPSASRQRRINQLRLAEMGYMSTQNISVHHVHMLAIGTFLALGGGDQDLNLIRFRVNSDFLSRSSLPEEAGELDIAMAVFKLWDRLLT